ncbi:MAG: DUF1015 domain-containing protein [Oscillospiraceae bacterium]
MNVSIGDVGLRVPRVLLPSRGISLERFAVIACDQFSSRPEYWDEAERLVGDAPSTLRLILPEARLDSEQSGAAERIGKTAERYLAMSELEDVGETFVYVKRQTVAGVRRGLVAAFDLEQYDCSSGAHSLIRATEGTVASRLPAREKIRAASPLELPHVMVLIDDVQDELFSMLESRSADFAPLYDFELMLGGGHISGARCDDAETHRKIGDILAKLRECADGFLFAMGDGNHSFAAAKQYWEKLKPSLSEQARGNHPARFALAELVNIHDSGLSVEPIHRLLCGVNPAAAIEELKINPDCPPPLSELQPLLDKFVSQHEGASLDYIHGADECRELAQKTADRLAVVYSSFERSSIFSEVARSGALPRKSFSLGEAKDKRYYLESRIIRV